MERGHGTAQPGDTRQVGDQLALLIDQVVDYAIFLLDIDGCVVSWNAGAERAKGYSAAEILGRHYSIFYPPESRAAGLPDQLLRDAARDGRVETEGWRIRRDGSTFWASVVVTAIYREGQLVGFGKVTRDLTLRREIEHQLRAANEELNRFAAIVAHDLAEPVNTSRGFAELMLERHPGELPADVAEGLRHIADSAERMAEMISSLLAYARTGRQEQRPVDVRRAAEAAISGLQGAVAERSATVELDIADDARVLADDGDLEIVIQNLVSNAIKFGAADGPRIQVTAERSGAAWRIAVTDDGIGVPPGDRDRIFGAFERAERGERGYERGVGLGLAICERIVRRRNGAIGIDPVDGGGSTFWFELPAAV